jgi:hypothetical protein
MRGRSAAGLDGDDSAAAEDLKSGPFDHPIRPDSTGSQPPRLDATRGPMVTQERTWLVDLSG